MEHATRASHGLTGTVSHVTSRSRAHRYSLTRDFKVSLLLFILTFLLAWTPAYLLYSYVFTSTHVHMRICAGVQSEHALKGDVANRVRDG